ncbi:MAG: TRL-like family protein [Methylococcaceae bacterium]
MTIKIGKAILVGGLVLISAGCASTFPAGGIYSNIQLPLEVTHEGSRSHKMGTSSCKSYFAMVATGDCSIETAKKNGGIKHVHHIDWDVQNIIGLGTYTMTVYGD